MALANRYWAKVDKRTPTDCWLWIGAKNSNGYGQINAGGRRGTNLYAHRVAWEMVYGPIPVGLEIDHLCRVRLCVNPAHLKPVTHRENLLRGANATKTHCKHGHEFTPKNTGRIRGHRRCRACNAESERLRRIAKALGQPSESAVGTRQTEH